MRRGTVLLALVLITVGIYSLLAQYNIDIPSWDRIWPVLPFAGGLAMLINYMRGPRRDHSRVFWGTALTLSGLFFFLITLRDRDYSVLETWWPVFVVVAGISFLALWLSAGLRDSSSLFLAIVGMLFGGAALAVNLQPGIAPQLVQLWPALVIIVGLLLLVRGVLSK